jgi:hypothetical protein
MGTANKIKGNNNPQKSFKVENTTRINRHVNKAAIINANDSTIKFFKMELLPLKKI